MDCAASGSDGQMGTPTKGSLPHVLRHSSQGCIPGSLAPLPASVGQLLQYTAPAARSPTGSTKQLNSERPWIPAPQIVSKFAISFLRSSLFRPHSADRWQYSLGLAAFTYSPATRTIRRFCSFLRWPPPFRTVALPFHVVLLLV